MLKTRGLNHIDLGTKDMEAMQLEVCHMLRTFVADDAEPRVRFRLEGRRKVEAARNG